MATVRQVAYHEALHTLVAHRLGIPQPKASRLLRGDAEGISVEKLITFLTQLGQDVRIVVSEARGGCQKGAGCLHEELAGSKT